MKNFKVTFSKQAKKELNSIIYYIKNILLEPRVAKNLLKRFNDKVISLENSPEKFPQIEKDIMQKNNIRKCIVGNYIIIYQVNTELRQVDISHIFYAGRDWINLL